MNDQLAKELREELIAQMVIVRADIDKALATPGIPANVRIHMRTWLLMIQKWENDLNPEP